MASRKRSLSTPSENSPKRKNRQVNSFQNNYFSLFNALFMIIYYIQNRSDKFCWLCHRPNGGLRGCSKCFRVFHRDCLVSSTGQPVEIKSPSEWLCDECIAFNNRKQENPAQINILLNYLLNKVNNVQAHAGLGLAIRSNPTLKNTQKRALGQNASQSLCLFRHLPYILHDYQNDERMTTIWECTSSLLRICETIYSTEVRESEIR